MLTLLKHRIAKRRTGIIALRTRSEIVSGKMKPDAGCAAERPFHRLRLHFNTLEFGLLQRRATVRVIPVTEVVQLSPGRAGNAPMRHLVQRAGGKVFPEDDARRRLYRGRQVFGFGATADQHRVFGGSKRGIEQRDQGRRIRHNCSHTPSPTSWQNGAHSTR